MRRAAAIALLCIGPLAWAACSEEPASEVRRIPISDLEGVVTMPGEGVLLDLETSWDGNGALHMRAEGPSQVFLYDLRDVDVEAGILVYRARLRARDVEGKVYLEMFLTFPQKGTFFSRGPQASLTGTTGWEDSETRFLLKPGENPSRVQLNLVIDGTGDVWVDDIRLLKSAHSS